MFGAVFIFKARKISILIIFTHQAWIRPCLQAHQLIKYSFLNSFNIIHLFNNEIWKYIIRVEPGFRTTKPGQAVRLARLLGPSAIDSEYQQSFLADLCKWKRQLQPQGDDNRVEQQALFPEEAERSAAADLRCAEAVWCGAGGFYHLAGEEAARRPPERRSRKDAGA